MAAARVLGCFNLERIVVSQSGRSGLDGAGLGRLQARGCRQPLPGVSKGGVAISLIFFMRAMDI